MDLAALPRPTRTEAEQVAERLRANWVSICSKSPPILTDEVWVDLVQTVFRYSAEAIESRRLEGEVQL